MLITKRILPKIISTISIFGLNNIDSLTTWKPVADSKRSIITHNNQYQNKKLIYTFSKQKVIDDL